MNSNELAIRVEEMMREGGIDEFAIVPVDRLSGAEPGFRPQDLMPSARSVIIYAIRLFEFPRLEILNPEGKPMGMTEYTANFFIAANLLDQLAYRTAKVIADAGFSTFPIQAGPPYDGRKLRGLISHKYVAEVAGLTQRGHSQVTISERFGPRIRLGSIITGAPLAAKMRTAPDVCHPDQCGFACAKACPAGALSEGPQPLDLNACDRFNEILISTGPLKIRCGRCLQACPVGKG